MTNAMPDKSTNGQVFAGLAIAALVFLLLRAVDSVFFDHASDIDRMTSFIGSHQRATMAYFAAATIGAFVARRGLLWPIMSLVVLVWVVTLSYTYAHREDYLTTLRVIDLDWPGAIMAITATAIAVKTGEWIARIARAPKTTESTDSPIE